MGRPAASARVAGAALGSAWGSLSQQPGARSSSTRSNWMPSEASSCPLQQQVSTTTASIIRQKYCAGAKALTGNAKNMASSATTVRIRTRYTGTDSGIDPRDGPVQSSPGDPAERRFCAGVTRLRRLSRRIELRRVSSIAGSAHSRPPSGPCRRRRVHRRVMRALTAPRAEFRIAPLVLGDGATRSRDGR